MRTKRLAPVAWTLATVCAALCVLIPAHVSAAVEPPPGAAGWMYEAGTVVRIDLTLSPAEEAKLEAEPFEYVKGTFSLAKTDGTPGGAETPVVTALPTEIRLKGNVEGSYRDLDGKAAFKLKFSKSEPFIGLRKMTLNNMVEDYSLIHESLAYRVFRAAGVPAPRTGYAYVRVNGEDFGLYLNLENLDKVNLERWFGPFDDPQHLYEGEYGTDVRPGEAGKFEVDEGDDEDRTDLEALIAAVNAGEGAGWSSQLAPFADLAEMTRMWAVEKYIGHWDGYSGRSAAKQPNNYYLYSDPLGAFQMLPWGTDLTWEQAVAFDGPAGLLFNKCLADPDCAAMYREQLQGVGELADALDLEAFAADVSDTIEPWWAGGEDPRLEFPSLVDDAQAQTLSFIDKRPGELAAWLATQSSKGGSGQPGGQTGGPILSILPGPEAGRHMRIGRRAFANGVLITHLHLSEAGKVSQRVKLRKAGHRIRVCSTHKRRSTSGDLTLHCVLSALTRRFLREHSLRLEVVITFAPAAGADETITRSVIAHRDPDL
jgi:CotH kinase protein